MKSMNDARFYMQMGIKQSNEEKKIGIPLRHAE